MADWTLPIETTQYLQVLANLKDRDVNAVSWGAGGYTNPPVSALRFDRASGHPYVIQEWDGAAWQNKIISVASGGTGSTNLNDFKASLGLGSMAYQNASTVAITGGVLHNVTIDAMSYFISDGFINVKGGLLTTAPADGFALKIAGRVSDSYAAVLFYNNAFTTEWGRLYVDRPAHLFTSMHLFPSTTATFILGNSSFMWASVAAQTYYSVSAPNCGFLIDGNPTFGFYYSQTYGGLAMDSAAISGIPAIVVGHTTSNIAFGGNLYPYADKAQSLGLVTNYWSMVSSLWHNAPAEGGFIFNGNGSTGFFAHSGLYPAVKYGPAATQYWAGDHTVILQTLYVQERAFNAGTIINQSTVGNFISFTAGGFSFNVGSVNYFNVGNGNVTIDYQANLILSPTAGSDANLKFFWTANPAHGMWLEGAAAAAIWHFNMQGTRLLNLHGNSGLGLPAVSLYHTVPTQDNALWMGYPAAPYRWYSMAMNVAPTIGSDGRDKDIIGDEKLGLNFINRLKPKMYKMPHLKWRDDNKKTWHGLVAQDVEKVLHALGIDFAGLVHEDDSYSMRYTEFIGPIIQAIQELDRKVEDAKAQFLSRQ